MIGRFLFLAQRIICWARGLLALSLREASPEAQQSHLPALLLTLCRKVNDFIIGESLISISPMDKKSLEKWRSFHRSEEAHRQGLFPLLVSLLKEERHLSTIPFKGIGGQVEEKKLMLWIEKFLSFRLLDPLISFSSESRIYQRLSSLSREFLPDGGTIKKPLQRSAIRLVS